MNTNILKNSNLSSIYLIYSDGAYKRRFKVTLRYVDTSECYLVASVLNSFTKPKRNTSAQLIAYTTDGVYNTDVKIVDTNVSIQQEIVFTVNLPKTWNYVQLRRSSRKEYALPFEIKFNDGYVIQGNTKDISLGGISFITDKPISEIYKKVNGVLSFNLPEQSKFIPLSSEIVTDVKYLRMPALDDVEDKYCYVYKFLTIQNDSLDALKYFLINIQDSDA